MERSHRSWLRIARSTSEANVSTVLENWAPVASAFVRSQPWRRAPIMSAPRKLQPSTRSEEHTSELQSLMRISYAVFCLKKENIGTALHHALTRTTPEAQRRRHSK